MDIERAARQLLEARQTGQPIDQLGESIADIDEAYATQDMLHHLGGWELPVAKVGCTSEVAQQALGVPHPVTGRIPASIVHSSPVTLDSGAFFGAPMLECEFGLRLGRGIGPGDTVESIADVVDAVVPAIELVDSRFRAGLGVSGNVLVADNVSSGGVVLGSPIDVADIDVTALAASEVALVMGGDTVAEGSGAAVLGDPLKSLQFAIENITARGLAIPAGTVVITGTCTGLVPCVSDTPVAADFGRLGLVELRLASSQP